MGAVVVYDPFAGNGDLLKVANDIGIKKTVGLDIDSKLGWKLNDSLIRIPKIEGSVIITNPPYLTNYSAKRKKIFEQVSKYFASTNYDDLYQIALEKCLDAGTGVIIIPETFINSSFPKDRLNSITILEDNPFEDTENPVCIVCFDGKRKSLHDVQIYKNDASIGSLEYFERLRLKPSNSVPFKFNDVSGPLALRAVDTTDPQKTISFMRKEVLDYDLSGIKHSSRLITIIQTDFSRGKLDALIGHSNAILADLRSRTKDVILSPFKGNRKDGLRRRRLDYATARAILETASERVAPSKNQAILI
ncbi:MAG TPA: hypothetical protein VMV71_04155 [Candidatus Paceibacterota bacterium]|nr:hypothetical protein [Candidatus Paceibacterota bacterium]